MEAINFLDSVINDSWRESRRFVLLHAQDSIIWKKKRRKRASETASFGAHEGRSGMAVIGSHGQSGFKEPREECRVSKLLLGVEARMIGIREFGIGRVWASWKPFYIYAFCL